MKSRSFEECNCLASLAVFRELYNSKKDIYFIICEFLKEVIKSHGKHEFTLKEISSLLNDTYGFEIPDAIVDTSLKRLKNDISKQSGKFLVLNKEIFNTVGLLTSKCESIKSGNAAIIHNLYRFIEDNKKAHLTENERLSIAHSFSSFIIEEPASVEFYDYISAFIVKEKRNENFAQQLSTIKEGVILYRGVKYSSNIYEAISWDKELTIFLEMEILFHYAGYNGQLYESLINDLFSLIKEINHASYRKNGKNLIHLKYFSDVKNDIDSFFNKAQHIVQGDDKANPSKTAMASIIDGCITPGDIIIKREKFYSLLKNSSIIEDDYRQYYSPNNHAFNIEDNSLIQDLSNEFGADDLKKSLQHINFINIRRRGVGEGRFEEIGYILLSGSNITLKLAFDERIRQNGASIPLATTMSFLTNRFWFKLNKGFGDNMKPRSFDVITRAQIVLSNQINDNVSKKFEEFQNQFKNGQLNKEEAVAILASLRQEAKKPEDINESNIESILSSIEDSSIEKYLNEQELLKKEFREIEAENLKLKESIKTRSNNETYLQKKLEKSERELSSYKNTEKVNRLLEYQNKEWAIFIKSKKTDSWYFFKILFFTIVPALVGVLIKTIKQINDIVDGLGAYQWIIWILLAVVTLIEIFGRAYLFDKEKIKSGWSWLKIGKKRKQEIKTQKFIDYKKKFAALEMHEFSF